MGKQLQTRKNRSPETIGLVDKLAYAGGDFGSNMSFGLKSYLTVFWTQYMGMDTYVMSALLILVQVWDAINDPLIGGIIDNDRRRYKRNKFLVYISVGSIGLTFAGALCFIPMPGAPAIVKNILFIVGYILWDAFYTIANVPYGAMLPLITDNSVERAELSTFRSIGGTVGSVLCMVLIPVLVYDSGNELRGEMIFFLALILGVIGLLAFQFTVRKTKIRVNTTVAAADAPKFHFFSALKNFVRNRALVGISLAVALQYISLYGATTAVTSMFQSYFKNAQVSGFVGMIPYLGVFAAAPFVHQMVEKFGKKESIVAASGITMATFFVMLFVPITPDMNGLIIYTLLQVPYAFGLGINWCLSMAMVADAIDYNEWKFGVRDDATNYAIQSFFRKLIQGIAPSLGLIIATRLGYNASLGAQQTMETAMHMRYLVPIIYFGGTICEFIFLAFVYNLDKKTLATMEKELENRRMNQGAADEN